MLLSPPVSVSSADHQVAAGVAEPWPPAPRPPVIELTVTIRVPMQLMLWTVGAVQGSLTTYWLMR